MDIQLLISQIKTTDGFFKDKVARTIDRHLTIRNWLIGFYIVEYEQNGNDRAEYGAKILQNIAEKLDTKGLSLRNLKLFRQFYNAYPLIGQTVSAFLEKEIGQTLSAQFKLKGPTSTDLAKNAHSVPTDKLISNLSFSHFIELIKIEDLLKRSYYEIEAIKGVWSLRELKDKLIA